MRVEQLLNLRRQRFGEPARGRWSKGDLSATTNEALPGLKDAAYLDNIVAEAVIWEGVESKRRLDEELGVEERALSVEEVRSR